MKNYPACKKLKGNDIVLLMSPDTTHIIIAIYRDVVEKNLTFLGLLVMENKLKPETSPIIDVLNSANVKTVMVTGNVILHIKNSSSSSNLKNT